MTDGRRVLFSVIENTLADGRKEMEVDWHTDLYPILDEVSANGEITDKLIDIAVDLTKEGDSSLVCECDNPEVDGCPVHYDEW